MKSRLSTSLIFGICLCAQFSHAAFVQNVSLIDSSNAVSLPSEATGFVDFHFYAILGPTITQAADLASLDPDSFYATFTGYMSGSSVPSGWESARILFENVLPFSAETISGTARNATSVGLSHPDTDAGRTVWGLVTTSSFGSLVPDDYLGLWSAGALVANPNAIVKPTVLVNSSLASSSNIIWGSAGSITMAALTAVPEPAHVAFLFGALGLGVVLWRRRR